MSYTMLRSCFTQGTRSVLPIPGPPCLRAGLHTSSVLHAESQRKRQSRLIREANLSKRVEIQQRATTERPHVVLGTKPGDDSKWESSDLARVLVRPDELAPPSSPHVISLPEGDVRLPQAFNYGVGEKEKELLFKHLPFTTAEGNTLRRIENTVQRFSNVEELKEKALKFELQDAIDNANEFARLIDLRNANAQGIAFENRRRVIAEFSEPGKPNDTGRPEVQAALLTLQIRNLWGHLSKFKRDVANRRSLRRLVHQRAKILRYLKGYNRDRYDLVLQRLGLEPESVEGELVV